MSSILWKVQASSTCEADPVATLITVSTFKLFGFFRFMFVAFSRNIHFAYEMTVIIVLKTLKISVKCRQKYRSCTFMKVKCSGSEMLRFYNRSNRPSCNFMKHAPVILLFLLLFVWIFDVQRAVGKLQNADTNISKVLKAI